MAKIASPFFVATVLGCSAFLSPTYAGKPAESDPALEPWFNGMQTPWLNERGQSMSCCNVSDCRNVDLRANPETKEMEVHIKGPDFVNSAIALQYPGWDRYSDLDVWVIVPHKIIRWHDSSPTGRPVLCAVFKRIADSVVARSDPDGAPPSFVVRTENGLVQITLFCLTLALGS